jgi:hypothetical protein
LDFIQDFIKCARSIERGSRRAINLGIFGSKRARHLPFAQIADRLDESVDWLLGRTSFMTLPVEKKNQPVA